MSSNNLSRVYPDASDTDNYTTGYWDQESCEAFNPRRFSVAVDLWDFE
ncbi:MAG: hypothetical protein GWO28_06160 [candidate division Zixibacteria bacterium]|nr:hypothetical protein [candidate division Zixibacteria bacterium]